VGVLHSQPIRTVATASEILASSLAGSARGFAVVLQNSRPVWVLGYHSFLSVG